jgi:hypothetical protein
VLHAREGIVEHPLRLAQLGELGWDDLFLELVTRGVEQAQCLDGTQVT